MTDNYTSAEMLKLVVKDVHFSVGKSDYMGWPTITIQNADGRSQWYVPSGDLRYMEEIEEGYLRHALEIGELRKKVDILKSGGRELLKIEAELNAKLEKEAEQRKKCAIEYNEYIRGFMKRQREMIEKDIMRDKLWRLKMQDEIQIAVNRCRRESKGGKK